MRIVAESAWSWLLCAEGERRWLIVVCGSVGLYECAVELGIDERAAIAADPTQIDRLARAIAGSRDLYHQRHLPCLLASAELSEAVRAWRAGRA